MDIVCDVDTCRMSAKYMQAMMDEMFKKKGVEHPKFIITYGPPGSGKSSMLNRAIYDNQVDKDTTVEINVDAIISDFDQYQQDIEKVKQVYREQGEEQAKQMAQTIYWKYRQLGATFSDLMLNMALLNRNNVVWETTGNYIDWTIKEIDRIRNYGYEILLVYPFVELEELRRRVTLRSQREWRFIDDDYIEKVSKNAQKNFLNLAQHADKVYLYNNNVTDPSWNPLVEITETAIKCDNAELETLYPKMEQVLIDNLLSKCAI